MSQFSVYRNTDAATRTRIPLLLNVQSDLLDELETRVVIPLGPLTQARDRAMAYLTPILTVERQQYLALTPQLAAVPRRVLGNKITSLADRRFEIIAAMDLLITGV